MTSLNKHLVLTYSIHLNLLLLFLLTQDRNRRRWKNKIPGWFGHKPITANYQTKQSASLCWKQPFPWEPQSPEPKEGNTRCNTLKTITAGIQLVSVCNQNQADERCCHASMHIPHGFSPELLHYSYLISLLHNSKIKEAIRKVRLAHTYGIG